jgi:hypothetical protein
MTFVTKLNDVSIAGNPKKGFSSYKTVYYNLSRLHMRLKAYSQTLAKDDYCIHTAFIETNA